MKYTTEIVEEIVKLYSENKMRVDQICEKVGIGTSTFYDWKELHSEFSEAIRKAERQRTATLKDSAQSSTSKLLNGFYYDVVEKQYDVDKDGNKYLSSVKTTTKYQTPNSQTIIKVLEKLDDNFKETEEKQLPVKIIFEEIEKAEDIEPIED